MPKMDANFRPAQTGPHGMCLATEILNVLEDEVDRHTWAARRQQAIGQTQAASLSLARLGALADALGRIERLMSSKGQEGADAIAFISAYGPSPPPTDEV